MSGLRVKIGIGFGSFDPSFPSDPPPPGSEELVDLSETGPYGDLGPEYFKVTGPMLVAGASEWPWYDSNYAAKAAQLGASWPGPGDIASVGGLPTGFGGNQWIDGESPGYYDAGLVVYKEYLRTGDTTLRSYARDWADAWYKAQWIAEGTYSVAQGVTHDPRHVALQTLMMRAIDGRPVMWDWIYRYVDSNFDAWIASRRANSLAADEMENGYRPTGYMLMYAAILSRVLPDSYPLVGGGTASNGAAKRADLLARLEDEMENLVLPLQQPNGSWVSSEPDEEYFRSHTAIFMPLWIEGIVETYLASSNAPLKSDILAALVAYGDYVWSIYEPSQTMEWSDAEGDPTGIMLRSLPYFEGGGSTFGGTDYVGGKWPDDIDAWQYSDRVRDERQIGKCWLVQLFGFLWKYDGDPKWLDYGDEWMGADFGNGSGPFADSSRNLADFMEISSGSTYRGKSFAQAYRSSTKYEAWKAGA